MKNQQEIFTDRLAALSPGEKQRLRDFINSPLYEVYLRAVSAFKPSANCGNAGSSTRDAFSNERANTRLAEMRGWELHEAALYGLLNEVEKPVPEPEPEFPDAGLMLSDTPPPKSKRSRKTQ